MSYTVADLKNELTGVLHGTTLNQIFGLDVLINRAARKVLSDCDPMEMIRIQTLVSPIFDRVYDYIIPDDVKGDRIIDIRPQVNRSVMDRFLQTYNEPFDVFKATAAINQPQFTVQFNSGFKYVRIVENQLVGILVNGATQVTGNNGTWVAGGNATNISTDTLNFVYGSGSIKWDVTAGSDPSTATISNSTMDPVDISRDFEQGSEFLYVYIPTASQVTSFTLRWGSSASDYWERTVTHNQFSNTFEDGWNLLQFEWHNATTVGDPDDTAVTFVDFITTYDGSENFNYRLNDIVSQLGSIYQIVYYSKYMFRDADSGAFQETVTSNSNIINLDVDSYNLLFNQVAYLCAQQVQGADSSFDTSYFAQEYDVSLKRYVAKIKSQVLKPTQLYYRMSNPKQWTQTRYSSM